ncbi:hypothetical protein [Arenibacter troitsensis]|uniref:Uncharacterized protein n=1 Tax=Arenibacter troitsensis TaxID=188872 RepID=A0A1X7LKJ0_9FLAO|nr:hypothetical protein [Arenibacter troitsensis]SMG53679.1 hypothetical protein SAMN03080602_04405 [Arenibacter troitsensis]
MKKLIYILLTISILSCKESPKREIIKTDSRQLIVYDYDTIVRNNKYQLTKKERDSVIIYEYLNLVDSTKSMDFRFVKHTNKLHFGPIEFELKESNKVQTDFKFDSYETEPIPDSMGSVLFNKDYGILAFDNGWGMQFHYLTNDNMEEFDLPIFYKMADLDE